MTQVVRIFEHASANERVGETVDTSLAHSWVADLNETTVTRPSGAITQEMSYEERCRRLEIGMAISCQELAMATGLDGRKPNRTTEITVGRARALVARYQHALDLHRIVLEAD